MFLLVKKEGSIKEELALIATCGVRIYSSVDDTGKEDRTISNEEFINTYSIVGTIGDEQKINEEEIQETENGDTYIKLGDYTHPKTKKGYFALTDEIDSISEECLRETAKTFGISIIDINSYEMVKEISELTIKNVKEYFGIDTDLVNPEN